MVLQSVTPGTVRLVHRPYTEVLLRVTYQCVLYDWLINPHLWQGNPSLALLDYVTRIRPTFPELVPFIHYYARNLAHGYTMRQLRDNAPEYTLRSIAKLKPRLKRP